MFNNKKIRELENELKNLNNKIKEFELEVEVWTNLYVEMPSLVLYGYGNVTKKVRVVNVVEDLLKTLGYEIKYEHTLEKEEYSLKKIIKKKKIKSKKGG